MTDAERSAIVAKRVIPRADRVELSHTVDFHHRYPGETVTLQTRLTAAQSASGVTLRVAVPEGLTLVDYRTPEAFSNHAVYVETDESAHYVVWAGLDLAAGSRHYFDVCVTVDSALWSLMIESLASLVDSNQAVLAEEWAAVQVSNKGRYLRNLPELYEQDEFMGRFLMLFESFWAPIESQVFNMANYFDPDLTPTAFLGWLASWVGMVLDENVPEERQRRLIRSAVWLYRRRGTEDALRTVLELYTQGRVRIIEHRAHDFRLGAETRLGPGFALGTGNRPHTFTIQMELPPLAQTIKGKRERAQAEKVRQRRVNAIIQAFKPAHTEYNLHFTSLS